MTVRCGPLIFPSVKSVKYLDVLLNSRLYFNEHGEYAAARAGDACRQLTQILPNLRGAKQKNRKVLSSVVTSRLLYGAPFWYPSITASSNKATKQDGSCLQKCDAEGSMLLQHGVPRGSMDRDGNAPLKIIDGGKGEHLPGY